MTASGVAFPELSGRKSTGTFSLALWLNVDLVHCAYSMLATAVQALLKLH